MSNSYKHVIGRVKCTTRSSIFNSGTARQYTGFGVVSYVHERMGWKKETNIQVYQVVR